MTDALLSQTQAEAPSVRIIVGDCREVLAGMPTESFDAVVTDPPYGLGFMGKQWDTPGSFVERKPNRANRFDEVGGNHNPTSSADASRTRRVEGQKFQRWCEEWAAEVYRVLKPGAYLLAFGGTRTYHRLACAIEDAGFEVRDSIYWHYGSGFPKSHNVVKALHESGLACSCPKTRVSHHHVSDEDLCDLQRGLDAANALSSGAKSDVRQSVLGGADRSTERSSRAKGGPVDAVRDLREVGSSAAVAAKAEHGSLLQHELPVEDFRGAIEPALGEHEGPETGGPTVRGEQPRMEGRGDAQTSEGELHGSSLCAGAGVGAADGPEGRIHHGAPARDGADVRLPPDQNGSGQPRGPEAGEQRPQQPDALSDERRPQAWGGWPVCGGCRKPVVPEGLGTALKPSTEPICVARKPLIGTVAENVLRYGTGALNIDATRVPTSQGDARNSPEDNTACTSCGREASQTDRSEGIHNLASPAVPLEAGSDLLSNGSEYVHAGQSPVGSRDDCLPYRRSGDGPAHADAEVAPADVQLRPDARSALDRCEECGRIRGDHSMPSPDCTTRHVEAQSRWPANLAHDGSDEVLACFPDRKVNKPSSRGAGGQHGRYRQIRAQDSLPSYADEGSAARFFANVQFTDEEWLWNTGLVSIAATDLSPSSLVAAFVRSDAAISGLPAGTRLSVSKAPSTSATPTELRRLLEVATQTILSIGPRFLQEWRHINITPPDSPVSVAATRQPTGIMMITVDRWRSDGSADPVTFNITSESSEAGVRASRFKYAAKATKAERGEGNTHPTVKPVALMRWLVRLVTPPGGHVLDPFAGSGTTGIAASIEQFHATLIELDPAHAAIARQRINREAPLFAAAAE